MGHGRPLSALVISSPGVRTVHCWSTVALFGSLALPMSTQVVARIRAFSQKTRADKKFLDINEAIEEIAVLTGAELRRPCETPESAAAHPKPSILPDRPLRSRRRPCGVGLRSLGPYGTEAVTSCPQNRLQPHVMGHSLGVLTRCIANKTLFGSDRASRATVI